MSQNKKNIFKVSVEKTMYVTDTYQIVADDLDDAVRKVDKLIDECKLTEEYFAWDDPPVFEEGSLKTTGDVECILPNEDNEDEDDSREISPGPGM